MPAILFMPLFITQSFSSPSVSIARESVSYYPSLIYTCLFEKGGASFQITMQQQPQDNDMSSAISIPNDIGGE